MAQRRPFASILLFSVPLVVGLAAACGSSDDSTFGNGAGDDGGFEATATLDVIVHQKNTNGISASVVAALDAASAADASVTSLLYPYDKTVFALGLTSPLVMWNAPKAGDTYRFELSQANYTYDVYATVGATGQYRLDQAIWDTVTASNKAASSPLTLTVSRYDATAGKAYVAATESFTV
ncbi:MAG: hypothetical protein ABI551_14660, partial [Polyangiaceae bacterium]